MNKVKLKLILREITELETKTEALITNAIALNDQEIYLTTSNSFGWSSFEEVSKQKFAHLKEIRLNFFKLNELNDKIKKENHLLIPILEWKKEDPLKIAERFSDFVRNFA